MNLMSSSSEPVHADQLKYNGDGLIPAIVQDDANGEVLMMAWMNKESLRMTLQTKRATYWSRSRQSYWVKGQTSGHFQNVKSIHVDCDRDTVLLKVEQIGAACHTGNRSCFFTELKRVRSSASTLVQHMHGHK